jgi:hypothetical protein
MPASDFGRAPAWTIKHRYPDRPKTTGAGYENLPTTIGACRKYSLSSRHKERDFVQTPGPDYVPPALGTGSRTTAFHSRPFEEVRPPAGPGPGKYDTPAGATGPKYTMKARQFPPDTAPPDGPGGGKYAPNWDPTLPSAPKPTIHDRTAGPKPFSGPGPGEYPIDRSLAQHPAAFHIRHREPVYDSVPGPGKYDVQRRTGSGAPAYSLRSRIDVQPNTTAVPYNKTPDPMGSGGPKWSLFIRPKDRDYSASPGPTYIPPKLGADGRKWSLRGTTERDVGTGNLPAGPGPGKFDTRPQTGGPKWTMKARQFPPDNPPPSGPGGGRYLPDYSKVLPSDLKGRQILERFREKKPEVRPGYVALGSTNKGKGSTIDRHPATRIMPGCWL